MIARATSLSMTRSTRVLPLPGSAGKSPFLTSSKAKRKALRHCVPMARSRRGRRSVGRPRVGVARDSAGEATPPRTSSAGTRSGTHGVLEFRFENSAGSLPCDERRADVRDLCEPRRPLGKRQNVARCTHVDASGRVERRGEARRRCGVDDDVDGCVEPGPLPCTEAEPGLDDVSAERGHLLHARGARKRRGTRSRAASGELARTSSVSSEPLRRSSSARWRPSLPVAPVRRMRTPASTSAILRTAVRAMGTDAA